MYTLSAGLYTLCSELHTLGAFGKILKTTTLHEFGLLLCSLALGSIIAAAIIASNKNKHTPFKADPNPNRNPEYGEISYCAALSIY